MNEQAPSDGVRDERRKQILAAAVGVFAERGYHAVRVQDVAREAGVAYGLVYHYFGSKSALLQVVFDENWALFADAAERIAASDRPPAEAIRAILDYVIGAFRTYPDAVAVLVLEFGRTRRLGEALEHPDVVRVLEVCASLFTRAGEAGELITGADPAALTTIFLGAVEAAIASAVLLRQDPQAQARRLDRLHQTLVVLFRDGVMQPAE